MARVKSKKYQGVYLNHLIDGDISYSINYKDSNNKKVWVTIGKKSNGINERFAYNKRAEYVNKINIGIDPLEYKKRKQLSPLMRYFKATKSLNNHRVKTSSKQNKSTKPMCIKSLGLWI